MNTTSASPPPDLATTPLHVEIHFDFVCPWCLIGKRQFDAAARRFEALVPDARVEVSWRSQVLLPETPLEGQCYESFYIRRLGSPEAVALRRLQVKEAGRAAGVHFEFDRIHTLPHTGRAHALVARAGAQGTPALQARLIERFFSAFFVEGEDIGRPDVLERLAGSCGAPAAVIEGTMPVDDEGGRASRWSNGVGGVPFFVFDRAHAVSGAASTGALLEAMLRSWQDRVGRDLARA